MGVRVAGDARAGRAAGGLRPIHVQLGRGTKSHAAPHQRRTTERGARGRARAADPARIREAAVKGHAPTLSDYRETIGDRKVDELFRLGERLRGTRVQHINSTRLGGGVAEILTRL